MSKKSKPKARSGPQAQPARPAPKPPNDPFASHHDKHQFVQKYHFNPEMFDPSDHDHQVALETILVLNRGMKLDEFSYRGNVFIGEPENGVLDLQWLALLIQEADSGRHWIQIYPAQTSPEGTERSFVSRIMAIRTGHEGNPASLNDVQYNRWHRAAKLLTDWQMPISMVALATTNSPSDPIDVRLFVPDEPDTIYNTFALQVWRQVLSGR